MRTPSYLLQRDREPWCVAEAYKDVEIVTYTLFNLELLVDKHTFAGYRYKSSDGSRQEN